MFLYWKYRNLLRDNIKILEINLGKCLFKRRDWIMKYILNRKKMFIYIINIEWYKHAWDILHGFISVRRIHSVLMSRLSWAFSIWHVIIMPTCDIWQQVSVVSIENVMPHVTYGHMLWVLVTLMCSSITSIECQH